MCVDSGDNSDSGDISDIDSGNNSEQSIDGDGFNVNAHDDDEGYNDGSGSASSDDHDSDGNSDTDEGANTRTHAHNNALRFVLTLFFRIINRFNISNNAASKLLVFIYFLLGNALAINTPCGKSNNGYKMHYTWQYYSSDWGGGVATTISGLLSSLKDIANSCQIMHSKHACIQCSYHAN